MHCTSHLFLEIESWNLTVDLHGFVLNLLECLWCSNRIQSFAGQDPRILFLDSAHEQSTAAIDYSIIFIVRVKHIVGAPNWLKLTEFELESSIICIWVPLSGHTFRLNVVKHATLLVHELQIYITELFPVKFVNLILLLFGNDSWSSKISRVFDRTNSYWSVLIYWYFWDHRCHWGEPSNYPTIWLHLIFLSKVTQINESLTVDDSKHSILPQTVVCKIAIAILKWLLLGSIDLEPSSQEVFSFEVLLYARLWALLPVADDIVLTEQHGSRII